MVDSKTGTENTYVDPGESTSARKKAFKKTHTRMSICQWEPGVNWKSSQIFIELSLYIKP